ncbi:phosphatidylglycerol/phosphatidylinositol transfer protein precursor [Tothia fuscella]|uniref:Phosphatidylglycerol/phosphatidylinositol transfer protein n=1 Tax=Tothia fuscella TaxID=1048955 RepID=A0A9P4NY80_9PEZI|nr:phosphatidylglycerol/phosphatidylinositol transfer protein precursor [Tothia fuscella]
MKFSTTLLPLLYVSAASARSTWLSGVSNDQAPTILADLSVPGKNPLEFCADPKDDLLIIENVDLDPNPPEAGKGLSIAAKGNLTQQVEEGAKVHIQVKYGLITLINQETDLCDQVKQVDLECPLKKGELDLTKDVELPSQIPPGKYTVLADVFTKDGDRITCLTATIQFHR